MKTKLRKILYPLLAAIAVLALVGSGALHRLDRWVQDWMYQQGGVPSPDIVLIGIDEETLAELGPYGPGYRSIMAYALEKLAQDPEQRPAAVAIDVLYEGESGTAGDAQLAAAAEKLGCVVTASMAEYGEVITWEDGHAVERNASAVVNYVEPYDALRSVTVQGQRHPAPRPAVCHRPGRETGPLHGRHRGEDVSRKKRAGLHPAPGQRRRPLLCLLHREARRL